MQHEQFSPHNIEAEQALLGALLLNNRAHEDVSQLVHAGHFYDPLHRDIYAAIGAMVSAGRVASPVTLKDQFVGRMVDDQMAVWQYLGTLASSATTTLNARGYATTVRDLALRRDLVDIARDIAARAYDGASEVEPLAQIRQAEEQLYELAEMGRSDSREVEFGAAVAAAAKMAKEARARGTTLAGISTGLADLDRRLGGLQETDLVIIAGRPGMGKTALATNIACNIANRDVASECGEVTKPFVVHFFSQEMSAPQLALRVLAEHTGVAGDKLRRGAFGDREERDMDRAAQRLADLQVVTDETGGITLAQLAAKARRVKRRRGTSLLVIDYLQLMEGAGSRSDNRVQELTKITKGLKALAKELRVPVIALSQLSREVEKRDDKRPKLSDLRESGSIEQDADVVMFVYREEYYLAKELGPEPTNTPVETVLGAMGDNKAWRDWHEKMAPVRGKAQVIIEKHRHGPTGAVTLHFDSDLTRFSDLAQGCSP